MELVSSISELSLSPSSEVDVMIDMEAEILQKISN
jgi:hypothetical protein